MEKRAEQKGCDSVSYLAASLDEDEDDWKIIFVKVKSSVKKRGDASRGQKT